MWDLVSSRPLWTRSVRKKSLIAAVLFVASFLYNLALPSVALAADATWAGKDLSYNGKTFTKAADIKAGDKRNPLEGTRVYKYTDTQTKTLEVLYIDKGTSDVTKATMAQYVVYKNFTPPDDFSEMSSPQPVTITGTPSADTKSGTSTCDSSIFEGLGWVLCPLSNLLAKAVDNIYGIISSFLVVTTLTTDQNNSIFKIWQIVVSLANMCFIFAFLYVVYLHLVNVNIEKYHVLKRALPRMLIAAIMVNVSYWACALAVDVSNLLGYSVERLFAGVRESVGLSVHIDWSTITSFILSAGAVGSLLGFASATGGSLISAGFLLISMLVSVVLAAMVAFIILAARQALIVIFIIISPLAFVAWTLPNTEKYFKRWFDTFMTLLMLFPIFSALFGGSMLAGAAIMNSANGSLVIALIGMAVQIVPLALTPLIIKFSTGLLGQIANITNNQKRGLADRTRNWAQDNAKHHRLNKLAKNDKVVGRNPIMLGNPARLARTLDRSRRRRDLSNKDNEDRLDARGELDYYDRVKHSENGHYSRMRNTRTMAHQMREEGNLRKNTLESQDQAHWEHISRTHSPIVTERLGALAAETEAKREKSRTDRVYTEVSVQGQESEIVKNMQSQLGEDEYQGLLKVSRQVKDGEFKKYVQDTALESAKTVQSHDYATTLKANLEGELTEAAGIGGKDFEARVLAKAKSAVSKAYIEDAKSIQNTMDYELATNVSELKRQFTDTSVDIPMSRRLAMVWASAQNGNYGYEEARNMIKWYVNHGGAGGSRPSDESIRDFKELVKIESSLPEGDRALELYLNDGVNLERTLDDFTNDMGTWNIKTSRFAQMGETRQLEAVEVWKKSGKDGQQMLDLVRADIAATPTLRSGIKKKVKEALDIPISVQEKTSSD